MKALVFVFVFLLPVINLRAQHFKIKKLVSDYEICLDNLGNNNPQKGTLLAIVSHETNDLLGYATAQGQTTEEDCPSEAIVKNHIQGSLMRPGNLVYIMDVSQADPSIPPSFTLLVPDEQKASVRFKPMVYLGPVLGQTAATLAPREAIAGLNIVGYAPRIGTQFDTENLTNLTGTPNLGAKFRWFQTEQLTLSTYAKAYFYLLKSKVVGDFEVILDNYSSARTASHTKLTIKGQRPTKGIFNQEKGNKTLTAHIESFYSVMLPHWDRLQIGPRYNLTDNLLGAYLGYAMMWDSFHIVLGTQFENILKPRSPAYNFDFFWRF